MTTSLVDTLLERTAALRAPIPGAAPAGVDVTQDADFERVKGEIDKLSSLAGTPPNWNDVIEVGERLLITKSKDLRLAAWWTMARAQNLGWAGFAEGLVLLRELVHGSWDVLYPETKRARLRANLFGWLFEQSSALFQPRGVTAKDAEGIKASEAVAMQLEELLRGKLGDLAPGLGPLRQTIREKLRDLPADAPAPAQAAAPNVPTSSANGATNGTASAAPVASTPIASAPAIAEAPAAATSAGDATTALRANGKAITQTAQLLRRADPGQAWPYRLACAGAWLTVQGAPPAEGGKTRIPPPPAEARKKLASLAEQEKWLDLLAAAHDASLSFIFWFDAHRATCTAMDRLGALFIAAREALGREVTAFAQRFPTIAPLAFSDGTPFADPGTKAWLDQEAARWGGAASGGGQAANKAIQAEDEEVQKRFGEARELATSGKIAEGLALGSQLARRASDGRTRFRMQLAVAEMAIEASKTEIARAQLESLLDDVEAHALERWEPELCTSVYASLLSCLRAARQRVKGVPTPESAARESFLYDKLSRLDPAAALRLAPSTS